MQKPNIEAILEERENQIRIRNHYEKERKKLRKYKKFYLKRRKEGNSYQYSRVERKTGKEKYIGVKETEDVIQIKRYMFFCKAIEVIDRNIKAFDKFIDSYEDITPPAIQAKLRESYCDARNVLAHTYSKEAQEWLEQARLIKSRYKPYKPEKLTHTAVDGTKVRSKSELSIINFLLMHGIPFVYELPVETPQGLLVPDFTIFDERTGKVVFWEHMGMIYDEGYFMDQFDKIKKYASIHYFPNVNIIITVDDSTGALDMSAVFKLSKAFLNINVNEK